MALGRVLTIAKYLFKGYVVNPILKKPRRLIPFLVLLAVILGVVLSSALSSRGESTGEGASAAVVFRRVLASYGVDKHMLIGLVSMAMTLMILAVVVASRGLVMVDEAELELLLAQPISMEDYVLGRLLCDVARELCFSAFYLGMVPLAVELSGGNMVKGLMLPVSLALVLVVSLTVLGQAMTLLKIRVEEVGKGRMLRLVMISYALVGIAHSAITLSPSPLLAYPLRPLAESVIYCLTVTETPLDVLIAMVRSSLVLLVGLLALVKLASGLSPEHVKPLRLVAHERQAFLPGRSGVLRYDSPWEAVRSYVLGLSVLNAKHVRDLAATLAVAVGGSLAFKLLVVPWLADPELLTFATTILIPVIVASSASSMVQSLLAHDLLAYWAYRVYMARMEGVARSLLLKYSTYLTEILVVVACIDAVLAGNPVNLMLPVSALPTAVMSSFLMLTAVSYLASKRRVVRQAPTGLYMFEELTMGVLWAIILGGLMAAKIGFSALLAYGGEALAVLLAVFSAALSLPLYLVAVELLSKLMERYDVML